MRILGIDLGDKRTGIAISDPSELMASGICTITANGKNELAGKIAQIAFERECVLIVLGNPINMDGSCGPRSERARAFGELLGQKCALPVVMFDERCTTMAAHTYLNATDTRGKNRKEVVDTLSAQIILQNYLDSKKR